MSSIHETLDLDNLLAIDSNIQQQSHLVNTKYMLKMRIHISLVSVHFYIYKMFFKCLISLGLNNYTESRKLIKTIESLK